ncbi:regulator of telomere elongation helicase 1-like protein, partial [Dinothrombium tinctorium]
MQTFTLNNCEIFFPYDPYPFQKDFMHCIIECLASGKIGLLESPTGTGKTLSLLCSTISFMKTRNLLTRSSFIYYTSNTHLQLKQVSDSLKKLASSKEETKEEKNKFNIYSKINSVVLGSKLRSCLNENVRFYSSSENQLNSRCKFSRKKMECIYYKNFRKNENISLETKIADIEDCNNECRDRKICSYYASRDVNVDLKIMPYFYLYPILSSDKEREKILIKKKYGLTESDKFCLIVDEAHRIITFKEDEKINAFRFKGTPCLFEEQKADENRARILLLKFRELIEIGENAIMFTVCRGSFAEGLDLGDKYCRCVVVVGLPYLTLNSDEYLVKKVFYNRNYGVYKGKALLQNWYEQDMKIALNQSVGRVIRHSNDFGIVLLIGDKFTR